MLAPQSAWWQCRHCEPVMVWLNPQGKATRVVCCFEHGCEAKKEAKDGAQVDGQKIFLLSNDFLLTNIPKDSAIQRSVWKRLVSIPSPGTEARAWLKCRNVKDLAWAGDAEQPWGLVWALAHCVCPWLLCSAPDKLLPSPSAYRAHLDQILLHMHWRVIFLPSRSPLEGSPWSRHLGSYLGFLGFSSSFFPARFLPDESGERIPAHTEEECFWGEDRQLANSSWRAVSGNSVFNIHRWP